MVAIKIIPYEEFQRIQSAQIDKYQKFALIADMNRANTLAEVKRAGSGHLGSSFSAMDIVTWLYSVEMNVLKVGFDSPDRDIYFSSKGHDVPGLYATMYSLGALPEEKLLKLRRYGGLDGHPDLNIPGIEANSGSLGMGISKGRGMAWAKKHLGNGGRVFVLTGDGEWQEGQNYEALQSTVQQKIDNLTVIVDDNKVQSDMLVDKIVSLGDIESKYRAFGWHVRVLPALVALMAGSSRLVPLATTPARALLVYVLGGLGCSAIFPLTLGLAGRRFPAHRAWVSSAAYATLCLGVGAGSFSAGLLRSALDLSTINRLAALPAALDFLLALRATLPRGQAFAVTANPGSGRPVLRAGGDSGDNEPIRD